MKQYFTDNKYKISAEMSNNLKVSYYSSSHPFAKSLSFGEDIRKRDCLASEAPSSPSSAELNRKRGPWEPNQYGFEVFLPPHWLALKHGSNYFTSQFSLQKWKIIIHTLKYFWGLKEIIPLLPHRYTNPYESIQHDAWPGVVLRLWIANMFLLG